MFHPLIPCFCSTISVSYCRLPFLILAVQACLECSAVVLTSDLSRCSPFTAALLLLLADASTVADADADVDATDAGDGAFSAF